MPNFCENRLNVSGDAESLAKFYELTLNPGPLGREDEHNYEFTLERISPVPEELLSETAPLAKRDNETIDEFSARVKSLTERWGYDNWYSWRIHNWGTKWDACETYVITKGDTLFEVLFNTAWTPPTRWLMTAADQFPTLSFTLFYMEEGAEFAGEVRIQNGEMDIEEGSPIYMDDSENEVVRDDDDVWRYKETGEKIEDDGFFPIARNPYEYER